ncbi:hypothetical protein WN48_00902 [Eufriesea mexicana]|uniref:Uncharacterized protein n=1 Tax=Eufriesea mexicana TaxID=516756 RepID=A0A310SCA4_9HYME|nr:hypothetical protein WN48_00902 [Eufriesea mexicana]
MRYVLSSSKKSSSAFCRLPDGRDSRDSGGSRSSGNGSSGSNSSSSAALWTATLPTRHVLPSRCHSRLTFRRAIEERRNE